MPAPILQAVLLAERVYRDEFTKNFIICGVFDQQVVVTEGHDEREENADLGSVVSALPDLPYPTHSGTPTLFFSVTECNGPTAIEVHYVNRRSQEVLCKWRFEPFVADDPLQLRNYHIRLPELRVEKDGMFGFDVFGNRELIGSLKFRTDIVSRPRPQVNPK